MLGTTKFNEPIQCIKTHGRWKEVVDPAVTGDLLWIEYIIMLWKYSIKKKTIIQIKFYVYIGIDAINLENN